ncbi:MAG TPA: serine/threonine-protein kinase [Polyangiaceae bacterium]|nr:serine/threonine-protein kinase [Polyangiaceae bacterium]
MELPIDGADVDPRIGRYEVIGRLGAGGMAELFLARARGIEGFEKLVALKRIRPELAADGELVRMFHEEARLAAKLQHPNIAQVFDIGSAGPNYFFTMEYVEGEDLRAVQRHSGLGGRRLPLEHALAIGSYVAAALHHAHTKRDAEGNPLVIVHRDVSPSNVLISYDGCVKLVDFGIAKASSSGVVTRSGALKGKLVYMSPEQCAGEPLDARSDIFSLGLVLYEILTGIRPFELDNEVAIAQKLILEDVPTPSTRGAAIDADVEAVLMRALARHRQERYTTAQVLQLELERLLVSRAMVASTVALERYMHRLFAHRIDRRRRELVSSLSQNAPTDATMTTEDAIEVAFEPPSVPNPNGRRRRGILVAAGIAALASLAWVGSTRFEQAAKAEAALDGVDMTVQPTAEPPVIAASPPVASSAPPATAPRFTPRPRKAEPKKSDMDAPFPGGSWKPKGGSK